MSSLLNNSGILSNPAFQQAFIVKRPTGGLYDSTTGQWVQGAIDTIDAKGSVQPAKASDLEHLSRATGGGLEIRAAIRIYSKFEFLPGTLGVEGTTQDVVEYKGLDWIVVRLSDFSPHGHERVLGVRLDGQAG